MSPGRGSRQPGRKEEKSRCRGIPHRRYRDSRRAAAYRGVCAALRQSGQGCIRGIAVNHATPSTPHDSLIHRRRNPTILGGCAPARRRGSEKARWCRGKWMRRLAVTVAALAALWVVTWLAVPPLVKWQAPARLSAALGRDVTLGAVDFHPWALEIVLHDLAVGGRAAALRRRRCCASRASAPTSPCRRSSGARRSSRRSTSTRRASRWRAPRPATTTSTT